MTIRGNVSPSETERDSNRTRSTSVCLPLARPSRFGHAQSGFEDESHRQDTVLDYFGIVPHGCLAPVDEVGSDLVQNLCQCAKSFRRSSIAHQVALVPPPFVSLASARIALASVHPLDRSTSGEEGNMLLELIQEILSNFHIQPQDKITDLLAVVAFHLIDNHPRVEESVESGEIEEESCCRVSDVVSSVKPAARHPLHSERGTGSLVTDPYRSFSLTTCVESPVIMEHYCRSNISGPVAVLL